MAKEKLITIANLKKALSEYSQADLIALIAETAQVNEQAREFLTIKLTSGDNMPEVLEKYKLIVEKEFFPKRGFGRLNLRVAKKAISDFKKMCNDKAMIIDIMLFYVENCVEFLNSYGGGPESLVDSAPGMFEAVIKEINAGDKVSYDIFAKRLRNAVENASDGWGFCDMMAEVYDEIKWVENVADD